MTSSFTSAHSLSASTFSLTPRATSQSDDDDDLASLPSGSDASDQDLSVWSDEESDAEAEWRESMQQLELLVSMVIIPFVGKFLGRKCAYWARRTPCQATGATFQVISKRPSWRSPLIIPTIHFDSNFLSLERRGMHRFPDDGKIALDHLFAGAAGCPVDCWLISLLQDSILPEHGATNGSAPTPLDDYDYIIVGSGPGGAPLAARLAIAGDKVLVIEAGGDDGNLVEQVVPGLALQATEHPSMSWDFYVNHYNSTQRQARDSKMTWRTPSGEYAFGSNPPKGSKPLGILYPRAGTLGGCAGHNNMITVYPFDSDWANIAELTGDPSWNPRNMRKYFVRLEKCGYLPRGATGHGFDGWLETSLVGLELALEDVKLLTVITAAATSIGRGIGKLITTLTGLLSLLGRDLNNDQPGRDRAEGIFRVPMAVGKTSRRSSPREFLLNVANAANPDGSRKYHLDIKLHTLVTKIRFDTASDAPRAVGVDFLQGRSLYRADKRSTSASAGVQGSATARKEVVISGGAFNTPQLLMLSGIGPSKDLKRVGVDVLVDLPGVGKNLQDNYESTIVSRSETNFTLTEQCTFHQTDFDPCLERWKNSPTFAGPYGTNGVVLAFLERTSVVTSIADLVILGAPANFRGYYSGYSSYAVKDAKHWTWLVQKARPNNRAGTVSLRSKDPRDTPLINFNYFHQDTGPGSGDEQDTQAMYEGMQFSRSILKNIIPLAGGFEEVWPGPSVKTEQALKDFIQREAWGHHASCTCPIGAKNDPNAVLDSQFRVRGVKALRVVDASVFPIVPGSYPALPIYMISEKAADVMIGDAQRR
ncbi:hypothetical protein FQN57_000813 [Myotisia sp. PD_48]|nr:hypothetical protein FQN57_000813 [Myotisia sp. PD_48]